MGIDGFHGVAASLSFCRTAKTQRENRPAVRKILFLAR